MMYTYPFAHPSQQRKTGETEPNPSIPSSNGNSVAWKVSQFDHFPTDPGPSIRPGISQLAMLSMFKDTVG